MKARVKVTREIVEVKKDGPFYNVIDGYERYYEHELDFQDEFDYWDKLLHQYAGMAMQGMLASNMSADDIAYFAVKYATALVEKLKEGNV